MGEQFEECLEMSPVRAMGFLMFQGFRFFVYRGCIGRMEKEMETTI